MVVLAMEAAVLWRGALGSAHPTSVRGRRWNAVPTIWGIILTVCLACVAAWWMWPRLVLEAEDLVGGAEVVRGESNGRGVRKLRRDSERVHAAGRDYSADACQLASDVARRNGHVCRWRVACVHMRRTWVAFAGLAVSAFSASVFDWHVLFDFAEKGGYGVVNFALAWGLFGAFVVMGVAMIGAGVFGNNINNLGQHVMERGLTSPRRIVVRAGMMCASILVALVASVLLARRDAMPKVEGEYVVCGRRWNAVPTRLCVYRDEGWSLKSVAKRFPDGARFCVRPGVPENAEDDGEVWLFGDAAESAWRFPSARLTLVSPPEFFDPPTNAVVLHVSTRSTWPITNAESQSR